MGGGRTYCLVSLLEVRLVKTAKIFGRNRYQILLALPTLCLISLPLKVVFWRLSGKQGVLRNFAKFTGKQIWQSLFFNKVAGLRLVKDGLSPATLLRKRL